ncbi:MAG: hypothetical protein RL026_812 [Pseudomonadota bacterium]|jgi:glutathione S-transferase
MYTLYIGNKNYSSWSLRPWVLMRALGIDFEERLIPFGTTTPGGRIADVSPSARVPCLHDGHLRVWDSLAIVEYLDEREQGVWPETAAARAWARCAAAEMHAGFGALRQHCSMTCGQRIALHHEPAALRADLGRLGMLWTEGLSLWGGPWLAGADFTAVDAFYAPVAFRIQTYGLVLPAPALDYAHRLLALPAMQQWYAEALEETFREPAHEKELVEAGLVTADFRRTT